MSKPILSSVTTLKREHENLRHGFGLEGSGGPPHDGGMETRIAKLEALVQGLASKSDLAEVRADFHKGVNDLIKWIVGTAFAGIVLLITIMTFVLNNAAPKAVAPSASSPAPIVIQLPATPPAPVEAPKP